MLDMKTVVFSYFITNTLITLFIALLWYQNRKRYAGLAFWLIDFILQAVGFLLLLLRDVAPDLASIVIAQMLIAAGALCIYIGLERFVGKPSSQIHNYLSVIGFVGLMAYFTFVQLDISIRTILISAVTLLLTGQCSWLLLRRAAPSLRPITRDVGVVFLLYALVAFVRIIELMQVPLAATSDLFEAPSLQVVFVFINQLLCIALTFTLILMVTRRLELDVQTQSIERTRAEQVLGESEKRFALAFRSSPYAITITRAADGQMIEVNEGFANITGYSAAECIGKTTLELNLWVDEQERARVVAELVQGNPISGMELRFRKKDGALITGLFSAGIFTLGDQTCILSSINDITERKRAEEILFAQVRLMEFASTHSFDELLRQTLDEVSVVTDSPIGFFHFVQADQKTLSLQAWSTRTLDEFCTAQGKGLHYDIDAAGVWVDCVQQRRPVIHNDYASLPNRKGLPEGHAPVIRELVVPIIRGERIVAILGVGNKPTDYNEKDVQRVSYFADMAWEIAERKRAEREIEHLASFPQLNANPILEIDASGTVTYQNQATSELLAQAQQDAHIFFPPDLPVILETLAQKRAEMFYREVEIEHRVFGENINLVPEFNVVRIYTVDITERKQAEEALRETNDYLENLFNYANAPIIVWDPQFKITRFNHAFETLTGRSAAEVFGKPLEILFPPAQVKASMEHIQKTQTGERWEVVEINIQNVDGSIRTVLWNSATLFSADGKIPIATIAQGQDITERVQTEAVRQQAEEKLAASEVRYRRLFEAARDGILILDAETGMVVDVNPFLIEILGFPREQFLGKRIWELGFFKDIAANRANFEELQRKEYVRYENLPLETGDGRQIEVEFVSNVYLVNHHKVIQCNVRDITARKRAEQTLRESEARFRVIFEQVAVGVALGNSTTGEYVQLNQKHCDIVGYTREELLNKTFQEITHPDDLQADCANQQQLLDGKIRSFTMEKRYIRKDGSIVWVNLTVSPMWQPGEAPSYHIAVIEEVTARKHAEAALKEYSERLGQMVDERTSELRGAQDRLLQQERLTVLGQIAGGIGHELRSPLGAIKNAVYLLNLSLQSSDPDIQETLQILNRQVDASDRIITSLLNLARPQPPLRRETDLREPIGAALNQVTLPENVTVCRQFDDALPALLVDPAQLQIVFHNLIRNAVQAMPNGGQLTIATRASDDQVSIAFSDTGGGIAPEDLAKIFQPLFSTKARGLGIGLALCKLLVDGHHGRIDVTSQVGAGTTFVVYLPRSG